MVFRGLLLNDLIKQMKGRQILFNINDLPLNTAAEINIARSSAGKKKDTTEPGAGRYYKESGISDEAQKEIVSILMREKRKNAARRTQEEV